MTNVKILIDDLIVIAIFATIFILTFFLIRSYKNNIALRKEPLVIEQVMKLQERVGARPDGYIGPETTRLVNEQCKLDEPNLFNKYAAPYMTKTGAPKDIK